MEVEKDIISLCLAARQHVMSQLSDMTNDGRWFIDKDGLRWNDIDVYLARFGGQPGSDSMLSVHCTTARKWVPYDRGSLMNIFMDLGHWSKTFYPYVTNVTVRELNLLNPFVEGLCFVSVKFCIPSPNFDSMEYQFYRFKSYMKAGLSAVIDVGVHFLRSDPFSVMFLRLPSALFVRDRETRNNCSMSEVIWIENMQFPNSATSSVLELSFKASRWVDTLISYWKRAHSSFHLCVDELGDSNELIYVCIDLLDGMRNEFMSYLKIITFDAWEVLLSETFSIYHRIDGFATGDYLAIQTISVPLCDSIVFQTLRKWTLESWTLCTDDQIMEFGAYDRSHSLSLFKNSETSRYFFLVSETDGFFHALSFDVFNFWTMKKFIRSRQLPLLHPAGYIIVPLSRSCCEVTIIVRKEVFDGEAVEVMADELQFKVGRLVEFGNKFHAREEALTVINASFREIIDKAEIPSALETCSISKALIRISVTDFVSLMMDLDKWCSFFTEIVIDAKLIDRVNDFDDLAVDGISRFEMFDADVGLPVVNFKPKKLRFGRFLKKFGGGVAVIVDISIDRLSRVPIIFDTAHVDRDICGVVVKENAGYTELIWIDNFEVASGFQFSGKNWLSIFSQRLNRLESGLLSREISVFGQGTSVWLRLADSVKGSYLNLFRRGDSTAYGWKWEVDSTPDVRVVHCGNKSVATTTFFVCSKHDVVYNFFVEKTVQFQWPFSYCMSTVEKSVRSEDRCNSIVLHRNSVSLQGDEYLLQESSWNDCFSFVISSPLDTGDVDGAFCGNASRTDFSPSGFVVKPVSSDSSQVTLLVSRVLSESFVSHRSKILCDVVDSISEECYRRLGMCNQAVGCPSVGAYRMNSLVNQAKSPATGELNSLSGKTKSKNTVLEKSNNGIEKNIGNAKEIGLLRTSLFVKVNMDGNSIGRKVDLSVHNCYETLAQMLEEMFCKPLAIKAIRLNGEERDTVVKARRPSKLLDGSSEFVLTFQDKDGDLMLVGDVPWDMFLCSVKRLRIMRASDANGLAPRFQEMTGLQRCKTI